MFDNLIYMINFVNMFPMHFAKRFVKKTGLPGTGDIRLSGRGNGSLPVG